MVFLNIGIRSQRYSTNSQVSICGNVKTSGGVFSTVDIVFKRAWLCSHVYLWWDKKGMESSGTRVYIPMCSVIWVLDWALVCLCIPLTISFHFHINYFCFICLWGFLGIKSWSLIMSYPVGAWDWIWDSARAANTLTSHLSSPAIGFLREVGVALLHRLEN